MCGNLWPIKLHRAKQKDVFAVTVVHNAQVYK